MILIIPELTEELLVRERVLIWQENIQKTSPHLKVASLLAWSIFGPQDIEDKDLVTTLSKGYAALSQFPDFRAFDVYIGFLLREDFEEVDTIIFESAMAKEIFELRFLENTLPKAKEIIIIQDGESIETEIYKRTIKYH